MTLAQAFNATTPQRRGVQMQLAAIAGVTISAIIGIIVIAISGESTPDSLPVIAVGGMTYLGGLAHGARIGESKEKRDDSADSHRRR